MKTKLSIFVGVVCVLAFPITAASQGNLVLDPVTITSSPNPVGSGARARALGMGSAFIAVADDATAASWNPGGLMQLETPEISMVMYYTSGTDDYFSDLHPEADRSELSVSTNLNYFSAAYPFTFASQSTIWGHHTYLIAL